MFVYSEYYIDNIWNFCGIGTVDTGAELHICCGVKQQGRIKYIVKTSIRGIKVCVYKIHLIRYKS